MKKHILIAEDDKNISDVMRIILEEEGYKVSVAKKQAEVMHVLKTNIPNLIFLDVRLGGESGEEIARALRSEPKTAKIPLIIVSADDRTQAIAERVSASGFLAKPFDMESLISLVAKHLIN